MTESEEGSIKVLLEEMNDKFSLVLEGQLQSAKIEAVGTKACLCVDARRQVDGHEDRIRFLERKSA